MLQKSPPAVAITYGICVALSVHLLVLMSSVRLYRTGQREGLVQGDTNAVIACVDALEAQEAARVGLATDQYRADTEGIGTRGLEVSWQARSSGRSHAERTRRSCCACRSELVKLQIWVLTGKKRVAVVFEGRDAAGKGGAIKRLTEHLNPRMTRVVALPRPTERERTKRYFQRHVEHLPAGGEIVLFDRSWYNRARVERVLGFCTGEEHRRLLRHCPVFERMLVEDGLLLRKYWFSVSDVEQQERFRRHLKDPLKR